MNNRKNKEINEEKRNLSPEGKIKYKTRTIYNIKKYRGENNTRRKNI
jgi:hypothetical protein